MSAPKRGVYEEWTPWPAWITVVLWGSLALSAVLVLAGVNEDPMKTRVVGVAALAVVGAGLQWIMNGISVRLFNDELRVGLGAAQVIRWTLPYSRIVSVDTRKYSPLADFGGWGYRIAKGKRAWTARGNQAVVILRDDGIQLFIGSDHPDRLRDRILATAGEQIGSADPA